MTESPSTAPFSQWAIVELLGHVRTAGLVSEESRFGTTLGRIDIPGPGDTTTTQYFGGSSVYRITPTTEAIARAIALDNQPTPVNPWHMPQLQRQLAAAKDASDPFDVEGDGGPFDDDDGPRF